MWDKSGLAFLALGVFCFAIGRILKILTRFFVDKNIELKERDADEAAKNSANSRAEYERLKREYDRENADKDRK